MKVGVLPRAPVFQGVCQQQTASPGGRRCESCHPDHFWKAGRYKLAAPVPKTGSAQTRGRSITDAFRHFAVRLFGSIPLETGERAGIENARLDFDASKNRVKSI